ncbi:MAG TPA: hypothetical protein VE130_16865 [Nitrososphaeraceae archaeon]|jgi:hypothetical protein|nr:hypothetical protein [Nitrososphaeraceae archaeon]
MLRSISEGKCEEQIAERFAGDNKPVRIWIETLEQMHFIARNLFDELVESILKNTNLIGELSTCIPESIHHFSR